MTTETLGEEIGYAGAAMATTELSETAELSAMATAEVFHFMCLYLCHLSGTIIICIFNLSY